MHEMAPPPYPEYDLEAGGKGVGEKPCFLDRLLDELYSSINVTEINGGAITHKQAQFLQALPSRPSRRTAIGLCLDNQNM